MIHKKKTVSQWSYEQALSVLIRGLGPSSTPDLLNSSVHWPVYYGNKLMTMFVNTKLKECHTAHTQLKCGKVMTVSVCSMRCGPTWLTFNGLFGQESKRNCLLSLEPWVSWKRGIHYGYRAANLIFMKHSRSPLQIQNSKYPSVIEPTYLDLCCMWEYQWGSNLLICRKKEWSYLLYHADEMLHTHMTHPDLYCVRIYWLICK